MAYRWVVSVKHGWYGAGHVETGFSADELKDAVRHARYLAEINPTRQFCVWGNTSPPKGGPPRWGYIGQRPRYTMGASDAVQYKRATGVDMPLPLSVGRAAASGLDVLGLGQTK